MRSQCLARQSRPDPTSYVPIWPPPFPTPSSCNGKVVLLVPLAVLLLGSETRLSRTTSMAMAKSIAHYGIPLPSVWFLYSPGPSSHTTDQGGRVPPRTLRLHQRAFRLSTSSAPWPSARARKISQRYTLLNPPATSPTTPTPPPHTQCTTVPRMP